MEAATIFVVVARARRLFLAELSYGTEDKGFLMQDPHILHTLLWQWLSHFLHLALEQGNRRRPSEGLRSM